MKPVSFVVLILCLLIPPLLSAGIITALEGYVGRRYRSELQSRYLGDTEPLLKGRETIEDTVETNVDAWLRQRKLPRWGLKVQVTVVTERGRES